jgi:hypothetical protein
MRQTGENRESGSRAFRRRLQLTDCRIGGSNWQKIRATIRPSSSGHPEKVLQALYESGAPRVFWTDYVVAAAV